ncbi:16998_t:CDS:2, partial [Acaulospora colombiana]
FYPSHSSREKDASIYLITKQFDPANAPYSHSREKDALTYMSTEQHNPSHIPHFQFRKKDASSYMLTEQLNPSHEDDALTYLSTEKIDSPNTPPSRSRRIKPNFKKFTKEYLDNIINSVLTKDERNKLPREDGSRVRPTNRIKNPRDL